MPPSNAAILAMPTNGMKDHTSMMPNQYSVMSASSANRERKKGKYLGTYES